MPAAATRRSRSAPQLDGLTSGVTYHFRLVATNQYGTTITADQTFGFYPPTCPNSQLRQETRSNDLPDCRAYELVTPSFAQGAIDHPGAGPTSGRSRPAPPGSPTASPSASSRKRSGEGMNSITDLYVSTRTDIGWNQRYIGLPAAESDFMGGPPVASVNPLQSSLGP